MSQHSLHFWKLCAVFEHPPGQAMAQHMWRNGIKLLCEYLQPFSTFQISLSLSSFPQLVCCLPTYVCNALANYARFDAWNERTACDCDLHANQEWFTFLVAAD